MNLRSHQAHASGMCFVLVSMQLQRRYRKLKSWHEVFRTFLSFPNDEPSKKWSRTGVEFVMNN